MTTALPTTSPQRKIITSLRFFVLAKLVPSVRLLVGHRLDNRQLSEVNITVRRRLYTCLFNVHLLKKVHAPLMYLIYSRKLEARFECPHSKVTGWRLKSWKDSMASKQTSFADVRSFADTLTISYSVRNLFVYSKKYFNNQKYCNFRLSRVDTLGFIFCLYSGTSL